MKSRAIKAAKANLVLIPLVLAVGIFSTVVITRTLEPTIYVEYATYLSLLSWIVILGEGGLNMGLARFLKDTRTTGSFSTFYRKMQLNRWIFVTLISLIACNYGPEWASKSGMNLQLWEKSIFFYLGLLAALTLHSQLASTALLATFSHRLVILTSQLISLFRAIFLGLVAYFYHNPVWLLYTLLVIAIIEAFLLHMWVIKDIGFDNNTLEKGMIINAQKYGLNILFDKFSTSLSGGAFLLLVLAGYYTRADLAMLAVATELIQKALSLGALPLSNIIVPLYNDSRDDINLMKKQVNRAGELMILLFSVLVGSILVFLPEGIPLLFGKNYSAAVELAMIWILPVFIESGTRMVWGAAMFPSGNYKWIAKFNLASIFITLAIIFSFRGLLSITTILILFGLLRILISMLFLKKIYDSKLFSLTHIPLRFTLVIVLATLMALLVQHYACYKAGVFSLLLGFAVYICFIVVIMRIIPIFPNESYSILCRLLGKYKKAFTLLVPLILES